MAKPRSFPVHPGARRGCAVCGGLSYRIVRDGEVARAELCECVGPCPYCGDSGWQLVERDGRRGRARCVCRRTVGRLEQFGLARVPGRHADSTRASFEADALLTKTVVLPVQAWIDRFDPEGDNRGLVLHGDVGRGKTHLAVALLKELVLLFGVTGRFVEFSHLLAELKGGFDRGEGPSRVLDPLVACDVLVIDELGKGRATEWEGTVVDELISRRYNAARPVIATTNYAPGPSTGAPTPESLAARDAGARPGLPSLVDRVGDRVYSRLRETCDFIEVRGEDYREVLAQRRVRRRGRS